MAIALILLGGCLKQDNVKRAEDAIERGDWNAAARFYDLEYNCSSEQSTSLQTKIMLNAGLAHSKAGNNNAAMEKLEETVDLSIDFPNLQSKALNELGNLYYNKTNNWLDQQNVMKARQSWKKAIEYYESAFEIDGNSKASENLESLKTKSKIGSIRWLV